jgi:septal ring factor EnvC (AmiA/AmiB activator)
MQMSLPELSKLEEDLEVLLDARSRAAELKEVRDKALYTAHELEETGKTVVEQQKHQAQLRETVDHLRNTIESLECKLQQLDANVTTRFKAFAPFFLRD